MENGTSTPQTLTDEDTEVVSHLAPAVMPRPFFPDSIASQPPVVPVDLERNLENVKAKILGVYRGSGGREIIELNSYRKGKSLKT